MFKHKKEKIDKKEDAVKNTKKKKEKNVKGVSIGVILALIVFLGLVLRLIGIKHGFPFIFHPDEPTIIRSALGIRFDSNPKHFDWPHFYIYLNYFLYMVFARIRTFFVSAGLQEKLTMIFPLAWNENLIYYYLTRCFSAILGAFTAVPVYLATKELFGKKAGVLGALAMTILPYHVWHSHYALGDVPMAFLLAWAFYFSTLIMKKPDRKNYILAGLFIGFSASVKYNGGLSAIMVPAAHFLRIFYERHKFGESEKLEKKDLLKPKIIDKRGIISLVLSGVFALLGFLIGTPYALLDFKTFSRTDGPQGAFWQFKNVGSVSFEEHISKFFSESFGRVLTDTGYVVTPVYFLVLFFLIYKIVKKKMEKEEFALSFVYITSLFLLWYLSGFKNNRSHYYFVIYPYFAVIFGFFCAFLHNKINNWIVRRGVGKPDKINQQGEKAFKEEKNLLKFLPSVFLVMMMSPPFLKSCINAYKYYNNDTRVYLYNWLIDNYDPAEKLVYNDKDLKNIFEKIKISGVRGLDNFDNYPKALIVIHNPGKDEEKFLKKNGSLLKEEVFFDNKWRLGSDIVVYKYESSSESSGCGCGR